MEKDVKVPDFKQKDMGRPFGLDKVDCINSSMQKIEKKKIEQ